jgi:hypothetical protein
MLESNKTLVFCEAVFLQIETLVNLQGLPLLPEVNASE